MTTTAILQLVISLGLDLFALVRDAITAGSSAADVLTAVTGRLTEAQRALDTLAAAQRGDQAELDAAVPG